MAGHSTKFATSTFPRQRGEWCPEQGSEAPASKGSLMRCYTYILLCADDSLYVGHTHDLRARLDTHHAGRGAHHTASRGVARLIYAEEHSTEKLAVHRELQIKKWSRAKKLALANGDPQRLRALSQSRD
jgi:putative endonuclease